jgi:hypothetical protein
MHDSQISKRKLYKMFNSNMDVVMKLGRGSWFTAHLLWLKFPLGFPSENGEFAKSAVAIYQRVSHMLQGVSPVDFYFTTLEPVLCGGGGQPS